jgi:tripartite-type tricarboxylate transporter receptor subunit TctC
MKFVTHAFRLAAVLAAAFSLTALAQNSTWPEKPIRFIVPYTPGGGTDTVTRHIAEKITLDAKWTFLVDNKPGGGGNIGIDIVAKSKPDGWQSIRQPCRRCRLMR